MLIFVNMSILVLLCPNIVIAISVKPVDRFFYTIGLGCQKVLSKSFLLKMRNGISAIMSFPETRCTPCFSALSFIYVLRKLAFQAQTVLRTQKVCSKNSVVLPTVSGKDILLIHCAFSLYQSKKHLLTP